MRDDFYIQEAFSRLKLLDEEAFDLSKDAGVADELTSFVADDIDYEEEPIIDTEAPTESDLQDNYLGKVIIECNCCHTRLYKEEDDVVIDEEEGVANVDEPCPVCNGEFGYTVIGKIEPFDADADPAKEDEPVEVDLEDEEEEEEDEDEKVESYRNLIKGKKINESKDEMNKDDVCPECGKSPCICEKCDENLNESWVQEWWGQTDEDPKEFAANYGLQAKALDDRADETLWRFTGSLEDIRAAMRDGYFYSLDYDDEATASDDVLGGGYDGLESKESRKGKMINEEELAHGNDQIGVRDDTSVDDDKSLEDDQTDLYKAASDKRDAINEAAEVDPDDSHMGMDEDIENYYYTRDEKGNRYTNGSGVYKPISGSDKKKSQYDSRAEKETEENSRQQDALRDYKQQQWNDKYGDRKKAVSQANIKAKADARKQAAAEKKYDNKNFIGKMFSKNPHKDKNKVGDTKYLKQDKYDDSYVDGSNSHKRLKELESFNDNKSEKEALGESLEALKNKVMALREALDDVVVNTDEGSVEVSKEGQKVIVDFSGGEDAMPEMDPMAGEMIAPLDDEEMAGIEDNVPEDEMGEIPTGDEEMGTEEMSIGDEEMPMGDEEMPEEEMPMGDEEEEGPPMESLKSNNGKLFLEAFDNKGFEKMADVFMHRIYENVNNYKVSRVGQDDSNGNIVVEGLINFNSGKQMPTTFTFDSMSITKSGKTVLEGINNTFSKAKAFRVRGSVMNKQYIPESFTYDYSTRTINESNESETLRIKGRVKR